LPLQKIQILVVSIKQVVLVVVLVLNQHCQLYQVSFISKKR